MKSLDSNPPAIDREKAYSNALFLIQFQVQLFWLVFGAFLLSETVIIGATASIAKEGNHWLSFFGAIFGLVVALPWWTSFRYNHAFYILRVKQARDLEPHITGNFFTEGKELADKGRAGEVLLSRSARLIPPRRAVRLLILVFVIAFAALAVGYNPWRPLVSEQFDNTPYKSLNQIGANCAHPG